MFECHLYFQLSWGPNEDYIFIVKIDIFHSKIFKNGFENNGQFFKGIDLYQSAMGKSFEKVKQFKKQFPEYKVGDQPD